jgi:non-canonical (house-cleaning) NTP pyrophosphatase
MKVGIGSKNKTKVSAVADLLKDYPMFNGAEVFGVDVKIEQFGHPKSIDETVAGAVDRAKQAYIGNDYGFGLESGLKQFHKQKQATWKFLCVLFMMVSKSTWDFLKDVSGQRKSLMQF